MISSFLRRRSFTTDFTSSIKGAMTAAEDEAEDDDDDEVVVGESTTLS